MDSQWPRFIGRYEFRKEVAAGGSSLVALAFDPELETEVAIKVLNSTVNNLQSRFLDEARLLRRVRSPHVVSVHDIGQLEDGRPYFVLDYADRGNLAARLSKLTGKISLSHLSQELNADTQQSILRFIDEFADGLDAVHEAGLVHRDLKPANIYFESTRRPITNNSGDSFLLLNTDERLLIGDLGIAKDLQNNGVVSTLIGGTPLFLAPEQMLSESTVTTAADCFGATAVLWNVISTTPPPQSHTLESSIEPLPSRWKAFFAKGLHTNPLERHTSINDWRWELHELLDDQGKTQVFTNKSLSTTAHTAIEAAATETCPYKGLNAYQATDTEFFYGREALSEEIHNRLRLHDILFIGGASGSGKSSLLRAGLIPILEAEHTTGQEPCDIHVITPGTTPMEALNEVFSSCQAKCQAADNEQLGGNVLVAVDQFEEIFTQCTTESRNEFLKALSQLNHHTGMRTKLVIVVRADFYAECARIPWLAGGITNNQVLVGPMTRTELRRAITVPAISHGYSLEPDLVDIILDDVQGETGSLPLLSHALVETWIRRQGITLTINGYRESGGVAGAISHTADALYEHQLDDNNRSDVRKLFLNLVSPGNNSPDTRRAVSQQELSNCFDNASAGSDIIGKLASARLLTVDNDTIQITHEALLREWPRLKNWIEEARHDLRARERIQFAAQEWQQEENDDLLYRGSALLNALEWQKNHPGELDETAERFVQLSKSSEDSLRERELAKERRINNTRRKLLFALSVLTLFTTAASLFAFWEFRKATQNSARAQAATEQAEARFATALGSTAYGYADEDPRLSLVLAAESIALTEGNASEFDARAALLSARWTMSEDAPTLLGSPLSVDDSISISLNPQGTAIAVGGFDGTVSFFDTKTRQLIQPPQRDHTGGVRHLTFSPSGRALVSASSDNNILLWQANQDGEWKSKLLGTTKDIVLKIAFLPDGQSIYSANGDGSLQQWYIDGKHPPAPLAIEMDGYTSLALDPTGNFLLASAMNKSYSGWSLKDNRPLFKAKGGMNNHAIDLTISSDSRWFTYLETDGSIKLGELSSGILSDHQTDIPTGAARFIASNEGERLVVGGKDGRLHMVDPVTGDTTASSARGHSQSVIYMALAPRANIAATLGRDQQIRIWTINKQYTLRQLWQHHKPRALAVNSTGTQIASGNKKGNIQIHATDQTKPLREFNGSGTEIWAASYSADDTMLATGDRDGVIRIWQPETGRMLRELSSEDKAIWSLVFSENMEYLWSASDTSVKRWNLYDGSSTIALNTTDSKVTRIALSETASLLAVSKSDGRVNVMNSKSLEPIQQLTVDDDMLWSVAFNKNGSLLAAASGSELVKIFSMPDGKTLQQLSGHFNGATDVEFLDDGATLVVSDRKGNLHWWDLKSGRRLTSPWKAHKKTIWRLEKLPDGKQIATTSDDGDVSVWNTFSLQNACNIGLPGFDSKMQNQYIGSDRPLKACNNKDAQASL